MASKRGTPAWRDRAKAGLMGLALAIASQQAAAEEACPDDFTAYRGTTADVTCTCPAGTPTASVWGTGIYTDDSSVCAAAQHAGAIGAGGGTIVVSPRPGEASYAASTSNGVASLPYGSWTGSFVVSAGKGGDTCPDTFTAYRGTSTVLTCSCPGGGATGSVWGSGIYTDDSSVCTAALHAGAIGPTGGSVTVQAVGGQDSYTGSTNNGVSTSDYGSWSGSFQFVGTVGGVDTCPDNYMDYRGSATVLTCQCPAGAGGGSVWGSGIYTDDSSICVAAQHAGVIGADGGIVTVEAVAGQDAYQGTTNNGITTSNYGSWSGSFQFASGGGASLICPDDFTAQRGTSALLTCQCTPESFGGSVWGSDPYTDDSSVCQAALHAGRVTASGGVVTVRPLPGEPSYPGSSRNGVTSADWGPWDGGFTFK